LFMGRCICIAEDRRGRREPTKIYITLARREFCRASPDLAAAHHAQNLGIFWRIIGNDYNSRALLLREFVGSIDAAAQAMRPNAVDLSNELLL
jgi:hypothetical protein